MLRSYPTNSPEAAGRVLAMALFSDGRCSAVELDTLAHEVVVADGHLAAGEAALVDTLWSRWHSRHINISTGDGIA